MKTKFETAPAKLLTGFALTLMSLGAACVTVQPASAQATNPQVTNVDPFADTQSSDGLSNLFSNRNDNSTSSVFDLLQRVMSGGTNQADFQAQQQQNLNDAAAEFRAKQQQLLRGQQGVAPVPQAVPPATGVTVP